MRDLGGEVDINAIGVVTFFVYSAIILGIVLLIKLLIDAHRPDDKRSEQSTPQESETTEDQTSVSSERFAQIRSRPSTNMRSHRSMDATKSHGGTRSEYLAMMRTGYVHEVKEEPKISTYKMVNYKYSRREYLMTSNERQFYKSLFNAVGRKYLIFPQIHLDALFRYNLKNQYHQAAFRAVQRYSVDYVLCDPNFYIVCAIELDDSTHQKLERQARDEAVERVFLRANLPLIRVLLDHRMNREELARYIFSRL